MSIAENLAQVKARVAAAARACGRDENDILLIGASKMNDAERVREAIAAGLPACGENRVQELREKNEQGAYEGAELHFIGTLQKNKVKYIVDKVSLIHSVDSFSLAEEISKRSLAIGKKMDILAEINIGGEAAKGGFSPESAAEEAMKIAELPGISLRGMMTMAPKCDKKEDYLKYFQETYNIFVDFLSKNNHNIIEPVLSMGMSDSYREAAIVGATAVRVGSALFGRRI